MKNKETLNLVSPIPPSVNHYLAYRAVMRGKKPVAMSYKTKEAVEYRKSFASYVSEEVKNQKCNFSDAKAKHFYADGVFYFPRIDMDANNYWKILLDAITDTGLVWEDDNVVCERVQGIYYDSDNPRIELSIYKVPYIGVFKDASHLNDFESKCIGCSRYTRNCSILSGAKDGRVQKDIADGKCAKRSVKK